MKVVVEPFAVELEAAGGDTIQQVLYAAGLHVQAPCGGKGTCGKCRFRLLAGTLVAAGKVELEALTLEAVAAGWRLACLARIADADVVIELPPEALLSSGRALAAGKQVNVRHEPLTRLVDVILSQPSLEDQRADAERLTDELGAAALQNIEQLRTLPALLRQHGYRVQAVVRGRPPATSGGAPRTGGGDAATRSLASSSLQPGLLLAILPPRPARPLLGIAMDIGTTTVAAELLDLTDGRSLGAAAAGNPQGVAGADVISRIEYAAAHRDGPARLKQAVAGVLSQLADALLERAGHTRQDVYETVVVGNTTMLHLLLAVDASAIAVVPFAPAFQGPVELPAAEIGLHLAPGAVAYCAPVVSGYVGADIVAGLAALEAMPDTEKPALFIDIGTNGEIALVTDAGILACSTAAGPAFEGARISCGMRAMPGAIDRVWLEDGALQVSTIDAAPASGVCGSGLLEAAAALLEAGALDATGRLLEACAVVARSGSGRELAVELAAGVRLSQRDFRELQLAKGAIQAGAGILLKEAGLTVGELARVYLAGAFGSFIRPSSAVRIGLLPAGVTVDMLDFLGNTALVGARLALLSATVRARIEELSRSIRYIELSGRPDFQTAFAGAMLFPAGDTA